MKKTKMHIVGNLLQRQRAFVEAFLHAADGLVNQIAVARLVDGHASKRSRYTSSRDSSDAAHARVYICIRAGSIVCLLPL